jgi:hypothetical protein
VPSSQAEHTIIRMPEGFPPDIFFTSTTGRTICDELIKRIRSAA